MQSFDSTEIYTYGMSKNLVSEKEDKITIKYNNTKR